MSILRLVRNFALLAVLALAAHTAAGANKGRGGNPNPHHCGGGCGPLFSCPKGCTCIGGPQGGTLCVPKPR